MFVKIYGTESKTKIYWKKKRIVSALEQQIDFDKVNASLGSL